MKSPNPQSANAPKKGVNLKGGRIGRATARDMIAAMALAGAAYAAGGTDATGPGKKFVLYGWDTGDASLETVLTNADKFADTGLDGISLSIKGNRAGDPRLSQTRDFALTDPPWTKEEFAGSVALLREITSKPGLRHSYLQVNWTPWTRLPWADDEAWANAAHNMGVIAWIAREGNVDGLFIDPEDYRQTRQFSPCPEEGGYEEISRLARRRGAQVMSAMAAENPDMHIVFFLLLSWSTEWLGSPEDDLPAIIAQRQDPWPPFVNGMLDALPPGMRLADGMEFGYRFRADRDDYIRERLRQQRILLQLVAPENLAKFRSNVQVSSGHYLDMYINPEGHRYYMPPLRGSRLARLEDNLHQGFAAADETVWLFGERRQIVDWEGNAERWKGVKTWEQALPGFADALRRLRDPRGWARKRLAAHRQSGGLTNLVVSAGIETWQGDGDPGKLEIGDDGLLRAKGARDGWFLAMVHGVRAGEWYLAEFEVKGETAPRSGFHWMENGAWRWDVAERFPTYDAPASPDGWRRGFVVARVPHGVDTISLSLGVKHKEDGEITLFRNVEIFKLVD